MSLHQSPNISEVFVIGFGSDPDEYSSDDEEENPAD